MNLTDIKQKRKREKDVDRTGDKERRKVRRKAKTHKNERKDERIKEKRKPKRFGLKLGSRVSNTHSENERSYTPRKLQISRSNTPKHRKKRRIRKTRSRRKKDSESNSISYCKCGKAYHGASVKKFCTCNNHCLCTYEDERYRARYCTCFKSYPVVDPAPILGFRSLKVGKSGRCSNSNSNVPIGICRCEEIGCQFCYLHFRTAFCLMPSCFICSTLVDTKACTCFKLSCKICQLRTGVIRIQTTAKPEAPKATEDSTIPEDRAKPGTEYTPENGIRGGPEKFVKLDGVIPSNKKSENVKPDIIDHDTGAEMCICNVLKGKTCQYCILRTRQNKLKIHITPKLDEKLVHPQNEDSSLSSVVIPEKTSDSIDPSVKPIGDTNLELDDANPNFRMILAEDKLIYRGIPPQESNLINDEDSANKKDLDPPKTCLQPIIPQNTINDSSKLFDPMAAYHPTKSPVNSIAPPSRQTPIQDIAKPSNPEMVQKSLTSDESLEGFEPETPSNPKEFQEPAKQLDLVKPFNFTNFVNPKGQNIPKDIQNHLKPCDPTAPNVSANPQDQDKLLDPIGASDVTRIKYSIRAYDPNTKLYPIHPDNPTDCQNEIQSHEVVTPSDPNKVHDPTRPYNPMICNEAKPNDAIEVQDPIRRNIPNILQNPSNPGDQIISQDPESSQNVANPCSPRKAADIVYDPRKASSASDSSHKPYETAKPAAPLQNDNDDLPIPQDPYYPYILKNQTVPSNPYDDLAAHNVPQVLENHWYIPQQPSKAATLLEHPDSNRQEEYFKPQKETIPQQQPNQLPKLIGNSYMGPS